MIIIDQVKTHGVSNTGDDTVPPGIVGLDWCHVCSGAGPGDPLGTGSLLELQTFLTGLGVSTANIRTPGDPAPSNVTYAGLDATQRTAAITAGALPQRQQYMIPHCFDYDGIVTTYET